MKKIYVGCALTHAPEEFRKNIEDMKDTLRANYEILDFVGLEKKADPKAIFEWDTNCVRTCDIFLAVVTYPSIGLGYEIGVALEEKKAILFAADESATVARILKGIERPNVSYVTYKDLAEIPAKLAAFEKKLKKA